MADGTVPFGGARYMRFEDAKRRLLLHGGLAGQTASGFLGMFRPYRGLDETRFHDLMGALEQAVRADAAGLAGDREVSAALWSVVAYTRSWVLDPAGLLQRNGLITDPDLRRVEMWLDTLIWCVADIYAGVPADQAFARYHTPPR